LFHIETRITSEYTSWGGIKKKFCVTRGVFLLSRNSPESSGQQLRGGAVAGDWTARSVADN